MELKIQELKAKLFDLDNHAQAFQQQYQAKKTQLLQNLSVLIREEEKKPEEKPKA